MDYFTEIQVLADPEFSENVLMNAIFSKLHRALVNHGSRDIGVSFPQYGKTIGGILRLHGGLSDLQNLMDRDWLRGLKDYTLVTDIKACPKTIEFRKIRRVQTKSNAERLRRRSIAKGWLTASEAQIRITKTSEKKVSLPHIELSSSSTGQRFKLFIEQRPVAEYISGKFSSYGLSQEATVPWF